MQKRSLEGNFFKCEEKLGECNGIDIKLSKYFNEEEWLIMLNVVQLIK